MTYDHIILISIDTFRADALETAPTNRVFNQFGLTQRAATPRLNQLAEDGAYFARTMTAAPYTSAAHASFFSGLWPLSHGLFEFYNGQLQAPTVFDFAKAAGMRTLFKTDFPVILGQYLGFRRNVDSYIVEDDDAFLTALNNNNAPSLSFAHFGGTHLPYGFHNLAYGGSAYRDKVAALKAECGISAVEAVDQLVETYRTPEDLDLLLTYKTATEFLYAKADYKRLMELYVEGVDFFMRNRFEPFLDRLLRIVRDRNALIVIFGDHGEEYDRGSRGHYNSVNEGVLAVPMIFYGHGIPAMQSDALTFSVDLAPTLSALQDWAPDVVFDGLDLTQVMATSGGPEPRHAFAQAYVSDARDFLAVQNRTMVDQNTPHFLRHVLFKETVWVQDKIVSRQFHDYEDRLRFKNLRPIAPIVQGWRVGEDGALRPDDADPSAMLAQLDDYNSARRPASGPTQVPDEIRGDLIAMGYRI